MSLQESPGPIVDGFVLLKSIEHRTGLSLVSLYRFIEDGLLPAEPLPRWKQTKPGGRRPWLVADSCADAFVETHRLAGEWGVPLSNLLRALRQGSHPQELAHLRPVLFAQPPAEKVTA